MDLLKGIGEFIAAALLLLLVLAFIGFLKDQLKQQERKKRNKM